MRFTFKNNFALQAIISLSPFLFPKDVHSLVVFSFFCSIHVSFIWQLTYVHQAHVKKSCPKLSKHNVRAQIMPTCLLSDGKSYTWAYLTYRSLPGRTMVLSDAYLFMNSSAFRLSLNVRLWLDLRFILPCRRAVGPFWSSARSISCTFCLPKSPLKMYVCVGLNRSCLFLRTQGLLLRWANISVLITRSSSFLDNVTCFIFVWKSLF